VPALPGQGNRAHSSFLRATPTPILKLSCQRVCVRIGSAVRTGWAGDCYRNVVTLRIDGAIESIGTRYALSDDELWRQHSWGVDRDGTLVETTDERRAYVGMCCLTPATRTLGALRVRRRPDLPQVGHGTQLRAITPRDRRAAPVAL
jgi:hypothetical protein